VNRDEARLRELGLWPPYGLLPAAAPERAAGVATLDWSALEDRIRTCSACGLCQGRTLAVPGTGSRNARLLLLGEAPGADEDRAGEPFVGRAGRLLDQMLLAIGLSRQQVYIANVLKCRPPQNRDPAPDELAACRPFLDRQIALLRPQVILALGSFAAQSLLGGDGRVGALRGRVHRCGDSAVVVTYHPAYLLRSPDDKRRAWEDLCQLRALLQEPAP